MGCVEDRWMSRQTGRRTIRYGRGKRRRAVWAGPGGQRYSRSFSSRPDAAQCVGAVRILIVELIALFGNKT